jgi:hypothetical protein
MADWNVILPVAGLAVVGYLIMEGGNGPNETEQGFDRFMSYEGPAFNSSSLVKQTRALSGLQPNWIKSSVPNASLNDPQEAETMAGAVRNFLLKSQAYEFYRYKKNGFRIVMPNNRKIIFVKNN